MDARLPVPAALSLQRHQVLQLTHAAGARLCPERGTVWVTQDDDLRDWVLGPGDCLVLEGPRPVLVQAFTDARLALDPAVRAA